MRSGKYLLYHNLIERIYLACAGILAGSHKDYVTLAVLMLGDNGEHIFLFSEEAVGDVASGCSAVKLTLYVVGISCAPSWVAGKVCRSGIHNSVNSRVLYKLKSVVASEGFFRKLYSEKLVKTFRKFALLISVNAIAHMSSGYKELTATLYVFFKSVYDFGCHSVPTAIYYPLVLLHYVKRASCGNYVVSAVTGRAAIVVFAVVYSVIPFSTVIHLVKYAIGELGCCKAPLFLVILSPKRRAVTPTEAVKVTLHECHLGYRSILTGTDIGLAKSCKILCLLKIGLSERMILGKRSSAKGCRRLVFVKLNGRLFAVYVRVYSSVT